MTTMMMTAVVVESLALPLEWFGRLLVGATTGLRAPKRGCVSQGCCQARICSARASASLRELIWLRARYFAGIGRGAAVKESCPATLVRRLFVAAQQVGARSHTRQRARPSDSFAEAEVRG